MVTLKNTETGEIWQVEGIDAREILKYQANVIMIGNDYVVSQLKEDRPVKIGMPVGADGMVLIKHADGAERRVYPIDAREHLEMNRGWTVVGPTTEKAPKNSAEAVIDFEIEKAKASVFDEDTIVDLQPKRRGRPRA